MSPIDQAKQRLDNALVARGLVRSRSQARDLIKRGFVEVDGKCVRKAAANVATTAHLALANEASRFVSRGGEKLMAALNHFAFEVAGRVALDVGASTGGFTDVLLVRGAAFVYAVDVGHDQLDPQLHGHDQVANLEGVDARTMTADMFDREIGAVVVDVSFVSLEKVLPGLLPLVRGDAWSVCLIKPQFEVGQENVGKGGVVRDSKLRQEAVARISDCVNSQDGWCVVDVIESPITGRSGNLEYLMGARRLG